MRESGLFARTKKAFGPAAGRCARSAPNLLRRRFGARAPDRKWVTDVKYVRTSAGWMYLAPVLDLFSRRIGGCGMSTVQYGDLSVFALASARRARGSPCGVLVHSDGGGIYGDEDDLKKLEEHGVKRSMSRKKNPWDNAVIESVFSTLRFELLSQARFAGPDEAERAITEWFERFYNLHRRHTTLWSVSPINYELAWQMRKLGTPSICPQNRGRLSLTALAIQTVAALACASKDAGCRTSPLGAGQSAGGRKAKGPETLFSCMRRTTGSAAKSMRSGRQTLRFAYTLGRSPTRQTASALSVYRPPPSVHSSRITWAGVGKLKGAFCRFRGRHPPVCMSRLLVRSMNVVVTNHATSLD
jgi:transposase InsO family protein